jgi:hypothetical protein
VIIATNMSKKNPIHDVIAYSPVERQVYDLFRPKAKVGYRIEDFLVLEINGVSCGVESSYKNAKLSVIRGYDPDEPNFHGQYPSAILPYNKDVSKDVTKFIAALSKINDLHARAKALVRKLPASDKVEDFLKQKLAGDGLTVRYWHAIGEISGLELMFHVMPEGQAPAQGVMLCFEHNTHKINPFWNGFTKRRSKHYGPVDTVDLAAGPCGTGVDAMKRHVRVIENLNKRIAAFEIGRSGQRG